MQNTAITLTNDLVYATEAQCFVGNTTKDVRDFALKCGDDFVRQAAFEFIEARTAEDKGNFTRRMLAHEACHALNPAHEIPEAYVRKGKAKPKAKPAKSLAKHTKADLIALIEALTK